MVEVTTNSMRPLPTSFPTSSDSSSLSRKLPRKLPRSGASILIEMAAADPDKCHAYCACQCHVRISGCTPHWLQLMFGTLFYQFSGVPLLNRRPCNYVLCRSTSGSAKVQYRFPTWLLPVVLEATATWKDLGPVGGSWSFATPTYLSERELRARYVRDLIFRDDNPSKLANLMDTYKLSARTIMAENGLCLLDVGLFFTNYPPLTGGV